MNAQSIIPPNIDYGKISADKYSPDETYEAGELRIQYNSLWKAKQKIPIPEPWTPAHWDPTTLAAELSAVNSRSLVIREQKNMSTGAWQEPGTVKSIDTGIGVEPGDVCIVNSWNNTDTSNLTYIPCLKDARWYISSNAPSDKGGGPDTIRITVLNTSQA